MAEPRKVQFVTLSTFAAGLATDSRKRRLEDAADINFDGDGEVDATATGADGGSGRFGKTGNRDATEAKKITVRLDLSLSEPNDQSSVEFNYGELIKNLQVKSKPSTEAPTPVPDPNDPFNDDETDRLQMEAMAKKFENKYGNTGKKRKDRMQDLIDIGFGYDETDPFIDNSEAYDELVPASLTTKLGGFYINTGTLQFRAASESEGEEGNKKLNDGTEQEIQRRKKKEGDVSEETKPRKNRVPKQGVMGLGLHRPEKKKRKKLMKDSLCLAAMIRRFNREKDEMRKRNPAPHHTPPSAHPHLAAKPNHSLASAAAAAASANAAHLHGNTAPSDLSLADLTADPAVMSLLGSANEKELQDLLGDLDFGLLDAAPQHAVVRENGLMGVGGSKAVAAGGGVLGAGQGRGLSGGGGVFSPPPLPEGLPAPLIKRIEDLRGASRQFDQEGRKKFFTLDMNNILLDIELQVQEQPPEVRSSIYSHMEAFVPCNKEALLKRLKKLTLNIQDDRLRTPLLKLKLAVCSVMPEQIARYNMDCMAKVAKQQSEEVERNGSEEEDEEKPGKRVMGPRKKFIWDDKLRNLLCSLVRVKLSCYELEKPSQLSVEDYLKAFMENEVKPLWPKGWMQARILLKESRTVHSHLTGNLVKRRVLSGPRAKAKEVIWIQNPAFPMTSTQGASTSLIPPAGRRPPLPSSAEPICLSDSLDEDLTAPTLDSISHALALLGSASKSLVVSPPPLQLPTSSYLPFSSTHATTATQHSLVKMESATLVSGPSAAVNNPSSSSSTSSSCSSPSSSALARLQAAGATLPSKPGDGPYGTMKVPSGAPGQSQHQRLVTAATSVHSRPSVMMAGVNKLHPQPSPSPPKQRPPPTASPLLPPHQKGFSGPAGPLGGPQGTVKSSSKPPTATTTVSSSSNGGSMGGGMLPPSRSSPLSLPRPTLQSYCPPVSSSTSSSAHTPSPSLSSHTSPAKPHPQPQHHQSNFITPMQATLTKSSHSSTSSSIIKLTPRPPGPNPAPPPSSSSSSLSQPQILSAQQHQFSQKAQGFRPPYCLPAGVQAKLGQASYSFAGGQKTQAVSISSGSITTASPSNKINNNNTIVAMTAGSIRPGNSPSPSSSSSSSSVSANHGQRQRSGGGAGQGSKAGNGRVVSGTPSPSHLAQVSSVAGAGLVGSPPTLPLGFGMLGGLVPVSLPFQFPSLLNFSAPPGVPGGLGSTPNSGFSLTQNELLDLYKSLQSGSQAALPPHLQLAFSDANQNQGNDMKRKSH
ncbi:unnamed protein product [Lota lota]